MQSKESRQAIRTQTDKGNGTASVGLKGSSCNNQTGGNGRQAGKLTPKQISRLAEWHCSAAISRKKLLFIA